MRALSLGFVPAVARLALREQAALPHCFPPHPLVVEGQRLGQSTHGDSVGGGETPPSSVYMFSGCSPLERKEK